VCFVSPKYKERRALVLWSRMSKHKVPKFLSDAMMALLCWKSTCTLDVRSESVKYQRNWNGSLCVEWARAEKYK
jgi:hypothetical protein